MLLNVDVRKFSFLTISLCSPFSFSLSPPWVFSASSSTSSGHLTVPDSVDPNENLARSSSHCEPSDCLAPDLAVQSQISAQSPSLSVDLFSRFSSAPQQSCDSYTVRWIIHPFIYLFISGFCQMHPAVALLERADLSLLVALTEPALIWV